MQLLQRGQTRGRWIPFADVTDANKWDWLRAFYTEDSSQTLQYPPIRRAVQQMLASDRGSVNGGGGETLVNLGVPLGGECSDGASVNDEEPQMVDKQALLSAEEPLTSGNQPLTSTSTLEPTSTLSSLKH